MVTKAQIKFLTIWILSDDDSKLKFLTLLVSSSSSEVMALFFSDIDVQLSLGNSCKSPKQGDHDGIDKKKRGSKESFISEELKIFHQTKD